MRKMKDSGIAWIGEIPQEWEIRKNKYVMRKRKDICEHYNGENILSLSMLGVHIRDLDAGGKMPTSFDGYQYVLPGDLLMCLFDIDVTPRCVGLVKDYGITSPAYSRFEIFKGFHNKFYEYFLLYVDNLKIYVHLSKNLRSTLTEDDYGSIYTLGPSLPEQQAIADKLDKVCGEIDKVIAKTKAVVEEYKKLKQAIITEAVTGKKQCVMRNSQCGIKEKWAEIKLKYLFEFGKGLPITRENLVENGLSVISYGQIHSKINSGTCLKNELERFVDKKYLETNADSLVHKGDFIFADTSEDLDGCGNCVYVDKEKVLFGGYHTIILKCKNEFNGKYLAYLFNSDFWRQQLRANVFGIKVFSVTQKILKDTVLILPLKKEQQAIVAYLDSKCGAIDELIAKKQQLITEMENYKKSVIYEYVTGKKEVG